MNNDTINNSKEVYYNSTCVPWEHSQDMAVTRHGTPWWHGATKPLHIKLFNDRLRGIIRKGKTLNDVVSMLGEDKRDGENKFIILKGHLVSLKNKEDAITHLLFTTDNNVSQIAYELLLRTAV